MKRWLCSLSFLALVLVPAPVFAQLGAGFGDDPIEITADGETRFEGGVAIAENNVVINYGDNNIFCDYAQYNPDTRDVLLSGHVRIYRKDYSFTGDRAVYNLETRQLRSADFAGFFQPMLFSGESLGSLSGRAFHVQDGTFTTNDSATPHYRFRAKSVRIYPNDRIIFSNATLEVGRVPVLWVPYLYQPLKDDFALKLAPGYSSDWGAFLLTSYSFPVGEKIGATLHLDLRSTRGVAIGLDSDFTFGKDDKSYGKFRSYLADDSDTETNVTSFNRAPIDSTRYRVSYESKMYFGDDIYSTIDLNLLSDEYVLQDFFPSEFQTDPQPNNQFAVTKWNEGYTLTGIVRGQLNDFQPTTERLPEVVLDIKRQPFFGTPLFYGGSTGVAYLNNKQGLFDQLASPDTLRADTLHQIFYPRTYGGWLSVIPRIGFRATYYSETGGVETETVENSLLGTSTSVTRLTSDGAQTRAEFLAGIESSFKFSKTWEQVQSRAWGLDGLRHVVQPYTNFSYVSDPGVDASKIPQYDRFIRTTQLNPLDFPQFAAIDSIDQWTVWRLGVRNRLQTRRDDLTYNWFEIDTFFDANIENPYYEGDFSNVFNNLTWSPLPWASLNINSQLPILDSGFTEVNSSIHFMVTEGIDLTVGNRYLEGNPLFEDSNLLTFGGYLRLNENWGFSFYEQYEFDDSTMESQRYTVHRDLSSWVASLGVIVRDNRGEEELGVLLSFTLKDYPQVNLPINLAPQGQAN